MATLELISYCERAISPNLLYCLPQPADMWKEGLPLDLHSRFQHHGCPRPANHGSSKCGGALVCPSTLAHIVFPPDPLPCLPSGNISAALGASPSIPSQKHPSSLLALALHAASTLSFPASYSSSESDCVFTLFNAIMTTHVSTVKHIPRACRSAFGEVLAQELRRANSGSIWGAIRFFLLAKCILRPPSRGGRRRFHATASLINNRIHQWENGEIESLWLGPPNLHFLTLPVCLIASHPTADGASSWHGKDNTARQSGPWTQKVLLLQVILQLSKTFLVNIHPHLWFHLPYRFSILCQLTLIKFCYLFRISPGDQVLDGLSWELNIYLTQFVVLPVLLHTIVSLNSPTGWIFYLQARLTYFSDPGLVVHNLQPWKRKTAAAFDLLLLGMFLDIWLVVFAVLQSFQESQICSCPTVR